MSMQVTAERFWNAFSNQLLVKVRSEQKWTTCYESNPHWTQLMMQALRQTGRQLGFQESHIYTEYFRLDMTWFNYPHGGGEFQHTLWNLEVAIEHENESGRWYDEFVKLSHISCGLKVLITYHNYYRGRQFDEVLDFASRMYQHLQYKPPKDSWLFIVGPTCQQPGLPWFGYTFDGSRVERPFELKLPILP